MAKKRLFDAVPFGAYFDTVTQQLCLADGTPMAPPVTSAGDTVLIGTGSANTAGATGVITIPIVVTTTEEVPPGAVLFYQLRVTFATPGVTDVNNYRPIITAVPGQTARVQFAGLNVASSDYNGVIVSINPGPFDNTTVGTCSISFDMEAFVSDIVVAVTLFWKPGLPILN